jgi:hypothetical protein
MDAFECNTTILAQQDAEKEKTTMITPTPTNIRVSVASAKVGVALLIYKYSGLTLYLCDEGYDESDRSDWSTKVISECPNVSRVVWVDDEEIEVDSFPC